jgi:hypothetical protein
MIAAATRTFHGAPPGVSHSETIVVRKRLVHRERGKVDDDAMNTTRRELLRSSVLLGGTALVSRGLVACAVDPDADGDGDGDEGQTADEVVSSCRPPAIAENHGHALVVPVADVNAGVAKTYSIRGTSGHDHAVAISAAQFRALGTGASITVRSTTVAGHSHAVTVTCVPRPPTRCVRGAHDTAIAMNHGHALRVPAADVTAARPKTYSIQGRSGHNHAVTLTAAHFAAIARGVPVTVTSSNNGHTHTVTVGCA